MKTPALRPLGRTGLEVSPLGLGLAALGRPGYINLGHAEDIGSDRTVAGMEQRAHEVLDAAFDGGVRYFDAARSYGRAEAFLASWLGRRELDPRDVTVGSKWGYRYTAGWSVDAEHHEIKEHSLEMLRRQTGETRALLGDFLDLYQIHSATLESGVLDNKDVLVELNRLASEGVVIGLSTSGPRQMEIVRRALDCGVDGVNPFSCVQATWNPLETSAGPALEEAHGAGWGVIVKEALANGRLTDRGDPPAGFREMARTSGVSVDVLAIAVAISRPWVDVVLSGAATVGQLNSNLTALDIGPAVSQLDLLLSEPEDPDAYWGRRADLPWN
jgi:aryl-alcohol dehydrogenase-like predicted oxidoreductase